MCRGMTGEKVVVVVVGHMLEQTDVNVDTRLKPSLQPGPGALNHLQ